ncbi:hypothetical protein GMLC_43330 [Geomonas limicola]|uniref:L,D-TPase catalytic domain-containing protein n=1 Tax=Geomonas limicola TaxID=2740186 RepID=A0A6V8NG96_9BACT|nr:hypothetical protein GMLC_43330 [Geomonas limicola]
MRGAESLVEVARRFDLGFNSLIAANPGVDPWVPGSGTRVTLPTARILPTVQQRPVILVNIPEFRLYYVPRSKRAPVRTFPLGIGEQGRTTPTGDYTVIEKIVHPVWHVPPSIQAEQRYRRAVVPPGPENPLGSHALRLSRNDLMIHGTNRPHGIGRRTSHGCLRLYPEDIVTLFKLVSRGTRVRIVDEPVKASKAGNRILLEAHPPVTGTISVGETLRLLARKRLLTRVDFAKVVRVIEERRGIPVDITLTLPSAPGRGN